MNSFARPKESPFPSERPPANLPSPEPAAMSETMIAFLAIGIAVFLFVGK